MEEDTEAGVKRDLMGTLLVLEGILACSKLAECRRVCVDVLGADLGRKCSLIG